MTSGSLAVNGRFLLQPATGVQRFAAEVLRALDAMLPGASGGPGASAFEILCPRMPAAAPALHRFAIRRAGFGTGHLWEQLSLPFVKAPLLNLANTGPLLRQRQVIAIHDASVYAVPDAYTPAFRLWYRVIFGLAGRRAARVITVSQFSKRELMKHAGLAADRIAVVQEGCDHILRVAPDEGVLARHGLHPGRYVLAVGSRSRHKNFGVVARAMEAAALPGVHLVVAGGSAQSVFSGTGGLPAWVKDVGRVSDAELRALYTHAGCFVFPSLYEGFGLPPLEAMACGCPVVASSAASLPEVCGDAAVYCNPESAPEFAAAITRVLGDEAFRAAQRNRGLERARQFTWARCAAQVWQEVETALCAAPAQAGRFSPNGSERP